MYLIIRVDYVTTLQVQEEVVVSCKQDWSKHSEAMDHLDQVYDVKVLIEHVLTFVHVKVSRILSFLWVSLLWPFETAEQKTFTKVSDCVAKLVNQTPLIHYQVINIVKLLLFRRLANQFTSSLVQTLDEFVLSILFAQAFVKVYFL